MDMEYGVFPAKVKNWLLIQMLLWTLSLGFVMSRIFLLTKSLTGQKFATSSYTTSNPGKNVNRFVFCKLLNDAWTQVAISRIAAFKTTGVYPPDRTAITVKTKEAAIGRKGKLGFIPLRSPVQANTNTNFYSIRA